MATPESCGVDTFVMALEAHNAACATAARARADHQKAYAEVFLAASGTEEIRKQLARKSTAELGATADTLDALATSARLMCDFLIASAGKRP